MQATQSLSHPLIYLTKTHDVSCEEDESLDINLDPI